MADEDCQVQQKFVVTFSDVKSAPCTENMFIPSPVGLSSVELRLHYMLETLGLCVAHPFVEKSASLSMLIEVRRSCREKRDYVSADAIRDDLAFLGIYLRDLPHGGTDILDLSDLSEEARKLPKYLVKIEQFVGH